MQDILIHQGGHRSVDGRQVRGLVSFNRRLAQALVNLRDGQMTVHRFEHRQYRNPRRHPPQPMGTQQLTDPLGDSRIPRVGIGGHLSSVAPGARDCHEIATPGKP